MKKFGYAVFPVFLGALILCGCGSAADPSAEESPAAAYAQMKAHGAIIPPSLWQQVSAGFYHSCGVASDHSLWCWGDNSNGELGVGSTVNSTSVFPMPAGSDLTWKSVAAGAGFTCAIKTNGALWCWGLNDNGQLGLPVTGQLYKSPTQVGKAKTWTSVATGQLHACAKKKDGTLWCWGNGNQGQLGNGNNGTASKPAKVNTATDWTAVSAGGYHTCARKKNGNIYCWGLNDSGQIGDGTTTNRPKPKRVGSKENWKSVWAGGSRTCGIKKNTQLWCWGDNHYGGVGDGTTTDRKKPVRIATDQNYSLVRQKGGFTCAIQFGTRVCWGINNVYQQGSNNTTENWVPTQADAYSDWKTLDAGLLHGCGIRSTDLSLWCWGGNTYGQVGNGDKTNQAVPVKISP